MILQEYQRFALECTFVVGKIPDDAPVFTLERFLPKLKKLVEENQAIHKTKNDSITLRLSKLDICDAKITMLFKYADKNATDPSFTHTETGKTRTVQKEDGEGVSVSAHLVLLRAPNGKLLNTYHDAILEEVPGLSRNVIEAGLTHMLSVCATEHFERDDNKKQLQCRPKISLTFDGNDTLDELLKTGTITGFVAVKTKVHNKLDEKAELVVADERIVLKVKRSRGQEAMRLIQLAKNYASDNEYSRLQIRYQSNNKRNKTLEVGSREQDIAEKMFAKSTIVYLGEKVEQCQEEIHVELEEKLVNILQDNIKERNS